MKLRDSLAENKSIRLQAEAETWQDAVKIGVDLLVAADVVEPRYYQAILDGVEQFGPYFVIAPGLAMPHGRPEEGVKKTGFSLVTLKKPLEFNHDDNDPVDILITMAAVDANTHQEADITAIKRLSDMGFKVTVTGGLALEDLPLFKGIPIHVFIAGRSIRDAASPVEAARQFKRSIAELWG
ncbi:L-ascorbate-specific enzyme IIA component of PTS [Escherichia coli O145:H28]|nr:L-ascorbate-specific enzyme IIA component of PTS [Escherichia coli O145:H28]